MIEGSSPSVAMAVYAAMATANLVVVSRSQEPMSVHDCIAMAALISFIGSAASATRKTWDWQLLLQSGLNSAVLGVSGALLSHAMIGESYTAQMTMLGVCGILSLGGLAVVDWAIGLVKSVVEKKVKDDSDEQKK